MVLPPRGSAGRANKKFWIHILLSLSRLSLRYVPRVSRPTRASPGDRHTARAVKCNVWPRPDEARGEAGDDATSPGALSQLPSDLAVVACVVSSHAVTPPPSLSKTSALHCADAKLASAHLIVIQRAPAPLVFRLQSSKLESSAARTTSVHKHIIRYSSRSVDFDLHPAELCPAR